MNTLSVPTIDLRQIARSQRHGLIFDRLSALPAGEALQLLNDHDPTPLRHQIGQRWPGEFECRAFESGPDLWRLDIRKASKPAQASAGSCCSGGGCCG